MLCKCRMIVVRGSRLCRRYAFYLAFRGYRFAQPPAIESLRSPVLRTPMQSECRTCSLKYRSGSRTLNLFALCRFAPNIVGMLCKCRMIVVRGSRLCRRYAFYLAFRGYHFVQPPVIESLRSPFRGYHFVQPPAIESLRSPVLRTLCRWRCRTCSRNIVGGIALDTI